VVCLLSWRFCILRTFYVKILTSLDTQFGSELTARATMLLTYYASPLCMLLSATLGEVLT
jgi:hypothetical protein